MAYITETELRRKLRKAAMTGGGSSVSAVRNGDTWEYSNEVLYLAYATTISNDTNGVIVNQSDATGFQYEAFSSTGTLLPWRGYLFSKSLYASGDPTDYIWEDISGDISGTSTLERYYSTYFGLLSEMGDPDYPGTTSGGTTVPWTSIAVTSAIPDTAFYLAERYTINGTKSSWNVYAIATEENGFGLISYEITGRNAPSLNTTTWDDDVIDAVEAFTGRNYTTVKEIGYGTAVAIQYDDVKQKGIYFKNSSSVGEWKSPDTFIDGDLVVDGTINTDKIAANAIDADKINVSNLSAISADMGTITAGSMSIGSGKFSVASSGTVTIKNASTGARLEITNNVITVYDTNGNVRVKIGDLT